MAISNGIPGTERGLRVALKKRSASIPSGSMTLAATKDCLEDLQVFLQRPSSPLSTRPSR